MTPGLYLFAGGRRLFENDSSRIGRHVKRVVDLDFQRCLFACVRGFLDGHVAEVGYDPYLSVPREQIQQQVDDEDEDDDRAGGQHQIARDDAGVDAPGKF